MAPVNRRLGVFVGFGGLSCCGGGGVCCCCLLSSCCSWCFLFGLNVPLVIVPM